MTSWELRLRRYASLTSTNDAAAELEPPSVVLADVQTAGRGRNGKAWSSRAGNLHMSVCLPTGCLALPGLATAVACRLALGDGMVLKWPNDLLDSRGRKLGGILLEASADKLVIGVGINLLETSADTGYLDHRLPTSLLAERIYRRLATACLWSLEEVRALWQSFCAHPKSTRVTVVNAGGRSHQGHWLGLTIQGGACLRERVTGEVLRFDSASLSLGW